MSEQISRRANNVTSSAFESPFETPVVRFGVGGLNLKDSLDVLEGWSRHTNIWHENEGQATARPGETTLATHSGSGPCHTIRKLRDPDASVTTRFWGVGTTIQRGVGGATPGTTSVVASGFSGDPLTLVPDRPPFSGEPWLFVGDRLKMVKIRADGLTLPIGLPAPPDPVDTALAHEYAQPICMCESGDGTQASAWTPAPGHNAAGNPVGTPLAATDTEGPIAGSAVYLVTAPGATTSGSSASSSDMPSTLAVPTLTDISPNQGAPGTTVPVTLTGTGFVVGATTVAVTGLGLTVSGVVVVSSSSLTANFVLAATGITLDARSVTVTTSAGTSNYVGFTVTLTPTTTTPAGPGEGGYDSWWGVAVSRDLTVLQEVGGGGGTRPATDDDIVHLWMKTSHPQLMAEIRLYIVVSPVFSATRLPGTGAPAGTPGDLTYANSDAYVKAFRPGDYIQFAQAKQSQIEAAEQARIYALRDKDSELRGYGDTRESWEKDRAQIDPARARSLQLGLGAQQWFGYGMLGSPLRRGDFQRLGSDESRGWDTVTGVIIYVRTLKDGTGPIAIGLDDVYLTGGFGPDTSEPGLQSYDYRVTNFDTRTGAEGNPGKPQEAVRDDAVVLQDAPIDPLRRGVRVKPAAYGDPAIRQKIYRRGGSLIGDWYYAGMNTSDGGEFLDDLADDALAAADTIPTDHYQPVPTLNESTGETILAQPVPVLFGPVEGMLFACGDPHRPGHAYFSIAGQADHWSASGNVEVCAPSEELMNGGVIGHQAFIFSRQRLYFLYPNLTAQGAVTAAPSLCTRGLLGRWAMFAGPAGQIFFVAEDGVFATNGGPEVWISEEINALFYGTPTNDLTPIDKTATAALQLTCWENKLYFQYQDTAGNRQVLVYSILLKFWRHYEFYRQHATLQGLDEDVLLIGGLDTGRSYTHDGTSDDGLQIRSTLRTGSISAGRREEKLYGDIFLDVDPASADLLTLQVYLNEETHANTAIPIATSASGRQRFLLHAFGESPQKAHSIACELRFVGTGAPPILYQMGTAITLQPDLTNTRVTNWDDLNSPDEVWLTGVTLDCDTGGLPKTIIIEKDFAGDRTIVATFDVTCANRHKRKFSWPAVSANMARIRPDPADCVPWLLYRADWIYVQEPPRISKWDIHFENRWDQYYTGLDLYCDTFGAEKRIEVWVDEQRLTNTLAGGLTYWPIQTNGRRVVHLTLPWGRGHVFRFFAIDDNDGLLYTHRWHLQEEPSEQANWNQNFSILGTHADKWLKAIIFECDTFGQNKSVNVEVDGTVVETLNVFAIGRKVVQIALSQQFLGRVWRMFPIDANPGRLYSAEPIFDEEPFCFERWETQETNHNMPGWFYPLYAHITLKSSADVTLTTVMQHNQIGGQTTHSYIIPATGGVKQRRFLPGFAAGKGVLIKYILTSPIPFWLYRDETSVIIQPWGAYNSIEVKPFGNDDLDPSRPMTHAVLAAQSSGGAAAPGQAL